MAGEINKAIRLQTCGPDFVKLDKSKKVREDMKFLNVWKQKVWKVWSGSSQECNYGYFTFNISVTVEVFTIICHLTSLRFNFVNCTLCSYSLSTSITFTITLNILPFYF